MLAIAFLMMPGCTAFSPGGILGPKAIDEPLRQKAEADPFPSAQQAGLAPQKIN